MAIRRLPGPPAILTPLPTGLTLYTVALSAVPSRAWRAAFLRPPARLVTPRYVPELARVGLDGPTVLFRTGPQQARFWLKRIDRWIAYANSVVAE
jgi:hypothetical protein